MNKRVVFTGGSGKAGRYAIEHLIAKGYAVLNLDLKPYNQSGVNSLITDLTDSGQVFNALTTHFGFDGFEKGSPPSAPDAAVHAATCHRRALAFPAGRKAGLPAPEIFAWHTTPAIRHPPSRLR